MVLSFLSEAAKIAMLHEHVCSPSTRRLVHELTRERVNEHLEVLRAAAAQQAKAAAASKAEADAKAQREREAAVQAFRAEQAAKKVEVAAYK